MPLRPVVQGRGPGRVGRPNRPVPVAWQGPPPPRYDLIAYDLLARKTPPREQIQQGRCLTITHIASVFTFRILIHRSNSAAPRPASTHIVPAIYEPPRAIAPALLATTSPHRPRKRPSVGIVAIPTPVMPNCARQMCNTNLHNERTGSRCHRLTLPQSPHTIRRAPRLARGNPRARGYGSYEFCAPGRTTVRGWSGSTTAEERTITSGHYRTLIRRLTPPWPTLRRRRKRSAPPPIGRPSRATAAGDPPAERRDA